MTNLRERKQTVNKWRKILFSQISRFNIIKVTVFPMLVNRISAIIIQIPLSKWVLLM